MNDSGFCAQTEDLKHLITRSSPDAPNIPAPTQEHRKERFFSKTHAGVNIIGSSTNLWPNPP